PRQRRRAAPLVRPRRPGPRERPGGTGGGPLDARHRGRAGRRRTGAAPDRLPVPGRRTLGPLRPVVPPEPGRPARVRHAGERPRRLPPPAPPAVRRSGPAPALAGTQPDGVRHRFAGAAAGGPPPARPGPPRPGPGGLGPHRSAQPDALLPDRLSGTAPAGALRRPRRGRGPRPPVPGTAAGREGARRRGPARP